MRTALSDFLETDQFTASPNSYSLFRRSQTDKVLHIDIARALFATSNGNICSSGRKVPDNAISQRITGCAVLNGSSRLPFVIIIRISDKQETVDGNVAIA